MSEAHPALTPLDFKVTPEELRERLKGWQEERIEVLVKIYDLVYRRALAALWPQPVLREKRRVLATGNTFIAFGWREVQEPGWAELLPEIPLPEPAVPDAFESGEPVPEGFWDEIQEITVETVEEEKERRWGLPELIELMQREKLGTPATYAKTVEKLLENGLLSSEGEKIRLSPAGRQLLERLAALKSPLVDPEFAKDFEAKLERIESGNLRPSDLFQNLAFIIDLPVREALQWLDKVGEPLAGEPAGIAYARRAGGRRFCSGCSGHG